jgi:phosphatidylglycerol lysyltransferase
MIEEPREGRMSQVLESEKPSAPASEDAVASDAGYAVDPLREPRVRRLLLSLAIAFGLVAFVVAFGGVARDLDYAATIHTLRRLPVSALALSVAMTALSFAGYIGREATALSYVGARPPRLALWLGGLAAAALGNVAGFGVLTAAAVRYRIYGAVGIDAFAVARIVGFVAVGSAIGLAAVGGGAAVARAPEVAAMFGWSPTLVLTLGLLSLGLVAALILFGVPRFLRFRGVTVEAPSRGLIALQTLWTGVRFIGAAAALWALLPPGQIGLLTLAPLFAAAAALGALSHIPAGAGVFEFVLLWALRGRAPGEAVAAALIAYRAIYYVLPLAFSAATLAAFEWRVAFDPKMPRADAKLARAASRLTPTFVGLVAFAIGVMLILSGATPAVGKRLMLLANHVPLWTVETASFLGSVLGVAFLFLTRGLFDRRDGAWRLAAAATLASLAFSLLKGLAFGEAALLSCFLALLLATRPRFDRPTSLFDQPFTAGWSAAVGAILAAAFGLLWLAFHNAPSRSDGLLAFAFDAQAPRALRAVLGACVSAAGFALWQLLRAPSGRLGAPDPATLGRALAVIEAQPRSEALMALMGDKALMFSASGRAFLMYGKHGRSWIALYDPVGPREEWRELVEGFVRLAGEHGGRANVYQARPESLPFYLDLGFAATKLGEEAVIDLAAFTLKGGAFHHLRYALKRGERDGLAFEWLSGEAAAARFDDLALISAEWLEARRGEEKGFSVAAFEPNFLSRQRVALLTERGRPVAFASVMAVGRETTLGLLRSAEPESPAAMEFLLCRLATVLREEGFERFSLGAAPLAGVRPAPLRTRWSRLAAFLWRHGDRFYSFQGLRAFKNKFNPVWEPRYFVSSGALGPFVALADAVALIGASSARSGDSPNA